MVSKEITVGLTNTFEVRPLAMVVQIAGKYRCSIYLTKEEKTVSAKSFMGVITLELDEGDVVTVRTEGADEEEAAEEIIRFLEGK